MLYARLIAPSKWTLGVLLSGLAHSIVTVADALPASSIDGLALSC
jgi:hypothetical protein